MNKITVIGPEELVIQARAAAKLLGVKFMHKKETTRNFPSKGIYFDRALTSYRYLHELCK